MSERERQTQIPSSTAPVANASLEASSIRLIGVLCGRHMRITRGTGDDDGTKFFLYCLVQVIVRQDRTAARILMHIPAGTAYLYHLISQP